MVIFGLGTDFLFKSILAIAHCELRSAEPRFIFLVRNWHHNCFLYRVVKPDPIYLRLINSIFGPSYQIGSSRALMLKRWLGWTGLCYITHIYIRSSSNFVLDNLWVILSNKFLSGVCHVVKISITHFVRTLQHENKSRFLELYFFFPKMKDRLKVFILLIMQIVCSSASSIIPQNEDLKTTIENQGLGNQLG